MATAKKAAKKAVKKAATKTTSKATKALTETKAVVKRQRTTPVPSTEKVTVAQLEATVANIEGAVIVIRQPEAADLLGEGYSQRFVSGAKRTVKPADKLATLQQRLSTYGLLEKDYVIISHSLAV